MFALRLCGLRLAVAADDLKTPALIGALSRFFWLAVVVIAILVLSRDYEASCRDSDPTTGVHIVSWTLAAVLATTGVIYILAAWVATRGGLLQPEKRSSMPGLLLAVGFLYGLELGCGIAGLVVLDLKPLVVGDNAAASCDSIIERVEHSVIMGSVVVFVDFMAFVVTALFTLNMNRVKTGSLRLNEFDIHSLRWQARCRRWCNAMYCLSCGLYGYHPVQGRQAEEYGFAQIGDVFAAMLHGIKLTPSEMIAGLLLVKAEQKFERTKQESLHLDPELSARFPDPAIAMRKSRNKPKLERVESSRSFQDDELEALVDEAHYMLNYSEGINTWKLHVLNSLLENRACCGSMELCSNSCRTFVYRRASGDMHQGDNCCAWNHTALVKRVNIKHSDLVFTHFASQTTEMVGFAVAVDHKRKTVVLNFRGTLSLSDFITDAALKPQHLHEAGQLWGFDGTGHYAHSGMLEAALKIRQMIEERGILAKLFRSQTSPTCSDPSRETKRRTMRLLPLNGTMEKDLPDCSNYDLLCVGESLGAAVSCLVTLLLKPAYPGVRGYGFSTPGCTLSRELAESMSSYFTTVYIGKDLVVRLGWHSINDILRDMLLALRRCKVNKNTVFKCLHRNVDPATLMFDADEDIPESTGKVLIDEMLLKLGAGDPSGQFEHTRMYCPGKLVHLAKINTEHKRRCCGFLPSSHKRSYVPYIVEDREKIGGILLGTSMVMDHMPFRLREAMVTAFVPRASQALAPT